LFHGRSMNVATDHVKISRHRRVLLRINRGYHPIKRSFSLGVSDVEKLY
jgi:hypothetical protein